MAEIMTKKNLLRLFIALELVKKYKNDFAREQDFEQAVEYREMEKELTKELPTIPELEDLWAKSTKWK